ncbi:MAG: VanZ family protein, partial [Odoribacter sp.]|nr:VanZ family protein [Odoribacter sp.]
MTEITEKRIWIAAAVLWASVIFILCAMPAKEIPTPHLNIPHLDKIVHGGMFFVMSVLLILPLERYTSLTKRRIYTIAVWVAFGYGGLMEILQHYCFGRSGDVWDLLADVVGGIVGCVCYPLVRRICRI